MRTLKYIFLGLLRVRLGLYGINLDQTILEVIKIRLDSFVIVGTVLSQPRLVSKCLNVSPDRPVLFGLRGTNSLSQSFKYIDFYDNELYKVCPVSNSRIGAY